MVAGGGSWVQVGADGGKRVQVGAKWCRGCRLVHVVVGVGR